MCLEIFSPISFFLWDIGCTDWAHQLTMQWLLHLGPSHLSPSLRLPMCSLETQSKHLIFSKLVLKWSTKLLYSPVVLLFSGNMSWSYYHLDSPREPMFLSYPSGRWLKSSRQDFCVCLFIFLIFKLIIAFYEMAKAAHSTVLYPGGTNVTILKC